MTWRKKNRGDILDSFFEAVIRLLIFLPLVALLAFVSLKYGIGKMQQSSGISHMQIVDRISLGPKSGLFVVKVAEQYFLLAVSESKIQILKDLPGYPAIQPLVNPRSNHEKIVSRFQQGLTSRFGKRGKKR